MTHISFVCDISQLYHKTKDWDISHTIYCRFFYNKFAINRKGEYFMRTKEAVAARILELCKEKNIAINALANLSGISPSTVYSMLNQKSKNPGVVSIKKICDGLGITVRQFFDCDLFDDTEQEIK